MTVRSISAGVIALSLGAAPLAVAAGQPPAGRGRNPHLTTTTRPSAPTSKPTTSKSTTTQTSHGNPHTTTTTKSNPAASKKGSTTTGTTTTGSTTTGSTTTTTTSTTTLNPIAQKIASKPNLSSKLKTMLPDGMSLNTASQGFKNQGQFIAALHVSQNLGIPFADLKTAMTGINPTLPEGTTQTPTSTMSLGQAIQKLRPSADADGATTTAEHQASTDLGPTTTGTSTTPKTPKKKTDK